MISTYAQVVSRAAQLGWSTLTGLDDTALTAIVRPLGLINSRVSYLAGFITRAEVTSAAQAKHGRAFLNTGNGTLITVTVPPG